MARPQNEAPNEFARMVATHIRRAMGDRRMSGRELARVIDMSEKYARDRLNSKFEFALNDIERFCDHIGVLPEVFIAGVERETSSSNVVPIRQGDHQVEAAHVAEAASDRPGFENEGEREQEEP